MTEHYLPLRAAAEHVYRQLTGEPAAGPVHPSCVDAAAAALSAFLSVYRTNGEYMIRASELEPAIERLKRAGVRFAEVGYA